MMTALNRELLEADPDKVGEITEALTRLASGEETEADRSLFELFRMVSLGAASELLVAVQIGGSR